MEKDDGFFFSSGIITNACTYISGKCVFFFGWVTMWSLQWSKLYISLHVARENVWKNTSNACSFALDDNDVFFLSSCANSYIGDNTAHVWQRAYNIKNLCHCRQVRTGPYSCTWILTPKRRCIGHFISIFPILKGIHISWRIHKEHTLCSRWGNYEVVVHQ